MAKCAYYTSNPEIVMAVQSESGTNLKIQHDDYAVNTYKDEWYLKPICTITINPYYDLAFNHRYSNAGSLINRFAQTVRNVFLEIFGINVIFNTPQKITSTPYNCLISNGLAINSYNIQTKCPANPYVGENCSY